LGAACWFDGFGGDGRWWIRLTGFRSLAFFLVHAAQTVPHLNLNDFLLTARGRLSPTARWKNRHEPKGTSQLANRRAGHEVHALVHRKPLFVWPAHSWCGLIPHSMRAACHLNGRIRTRSVRPTLRKRHFHG